MNWNDDDDVIDMPAPTRHPGNFVTPAPAAIVPVQPAPLLGYMPALNIPNMPLVTLEDSGEHDLVRAKAFAVRTAGLGIGYGIAAGAVTVIVLLIGKADAPIVALAALVALFAVFAFVWYRSLRAAIDTSAGGIAKTNVDRLWDFVDREQSHIHEMERNRWKP